MSFHSNSYQMALRPAEREPVGQQKEGKVAPMNLGMLQVLMKLEQSSVAAAPLPAAFCGHS